MCIQPLCVCVCVFMLLCPQPHAVPTSTNKLQAHRKGLSLSSPPASTLAEPAPHPVNDFGLAASPETLSPCPPTYCCLLSVQSEHMFVESDIDCSEKVSRVLHLKGIKAPRALRLKGRKFQGHCASKVKVSRRALRLKGKHMFT